MTKKYKIAIAIAIIATSAPFLLLFTEVRWDLLTTNFRLFSISFASIMSRIEGLVGIIFFIWQLLLGNRFLLGKKISDTVWLSKLHKRLGIFGTVFVFGHPLLQMYILGESFLFLISPEFTSQYQVALSFGRIAYLCFTVIWISSALLRKKIPYRVWHYVHALVYPLIFFAIAHSSVIGTTINAVPGLKIVWGAMQVMFLIVVAHRWIWMWSGLGKPKYTIKKIEKFGEDSYVYTVIPKGKKRIKPKLGQYCYIGITPFGEEHPFSVMDYDEKTGELKFGIKNLGRFSTKMSTLKNGHTLLLDGPYGVFTQEGQNNKSKVFIAGGIGITPFVGVIEKFGTENTYLLNCNRTIEEAVYRDQLKNKLGENYTDVLSDQKIEGDTQVENSTLTKDVIAKRIPKETLLNSPIFFCGSVGFYNAARQMLIDLGVPKEQIFYEEFSL